MWWVKSLKEVTLQWTTTTYPTVTSTETSYCGLNILATTSLNLKYHNNGNPISLHLKFSESVVLYVNNRHTCKIFWNQSLWKVMNHFSMCIPDCTCLSPLDESLFSFSVNSFLAASDLFRKEVSKEIKVNWHNQENIKKDK